jgi:hypothetical protein
METGGWENKALKNKNHKIAYDGKIIEIDYVLPDRQFKVACMRISDNAKEEGYVLTPKGTLFKVARFGKTAEKITEPEEKIKALNLFEVQK